MTRRATRFLWVDQYGGRTYARTVKELREKAGGGAVAKMYVDRDGKTYHVGYGVGARWFLKYAPVEVEQDAAVIGVPPEAPLNSIGVNSHE